MISKHKSSSDVRRSGRAEADLGQKEATLEKTQAELEQVSEDSLAIWAGSKLPKPLLSRKRKSSGRVVGEDEAEI